MPQDGMLARYVHINRSMGELNVPVHLEVFAAAACVFSPGAIRMAYQLAVESDRISAGMVDAMELPDLVERYDVLGSPMVLINGTHRFYGAIRETEFVNEVFIGIRQEDGWKSRSNDTGS